MNSDAAISHTHLLWSVEADILLYILDIRADEGQDLVIRLHVCIPTRAYTHTPLRNNSALKELCLHSSGSA